MEYKYYRDLKHNYLVFENGNPEEADRNRYQYKMMESGRIKGLVPCSERNINGGRFLYYEIGSMQPVRDRYAVGGMNAEQLRRLLADAASLLEELSEHLLGEEGLVFNARSVYVNLNTGEHRFLYCPFYDETMRFADLAVELLDLVDLSDEKAAELAYLLCEKSAATGAFTLETIKEILAEGSEKAVSDDDEQVFGRTVGAVTAEIDSFDEMEGYNMEEKTLAESGAGSTKRGLALAGQKLGSRLQLLFSLMFMAVVAAMMYIRMNYILTKEENMLSILVMLVSLVSGSVSFVGGIRDFKGKRIFGRRSEGEMHSEEFFPESEYDDTDDFGTFDSPMDRPVKVTGPMTGSFREQKIYGETVILDQAKESDDVTLYSRNLDKTIRIGLEKLPLTIGKMEGCVDRVLGDPSVSRIHCRLLREGGKLAIMDMGSTNGTFLNGIRLEPRKMHFFDEGDEIRMGTVFFDCR